MVPVIGYKKVLSGIKFGPSKTEYIGGQRGSDYDLLAPKNIYSNFRSNILLKRVEETSLIENFDENPSDPWNLYWPILENLENYFDNFADPYMSLNTKIDSIDGFHRVRFHETLSPNEFGEFLAEIRDLRRRYNIVDDAFTNWEDRHKAPSWRKKRPFWVKIFVGYSFFAKNRVYTLNDSLYDHTWAVKEENKDWLKLHYSETADSFTFASTSEIYTNKHLYFSFKGTRKKNRLEVKIRRFHPEGYGHSLGRAQINFTHFSKEDRSSSLFWIESYFVKRWNFKGTMVLDMLLYIKTVLDPTLSFRRSCREGICGSCAMNINGYNTLACLKEMTKFSYKNRVRSFMDPAGVTVPAVRITALPHAKPLRDLIPDVSQFYKHYKSIKPWLVSAKSVSTLPQENTNADKKLLKENYQSVEDRKNLDGLYECILCLCCNHSCPSYWWNEDVYLGPAVLMQAYRWIVDSRDVAGLYRVAALSDKMKLYACHSILACTKTCPKHLNPGTAISSLKRIDSIVGDLI